MSKGAVTGALPDRQRQPPTGGNKGIEPTKMTAEEKIDLGGVTPTSGHELDAFLGTAFDERPIWAGRWENIRAQAT